MLLLKFYLDFYICILFDIALWILLKSLTFRIWITVKDGKSFCQIIGDEVIHIFERNHEEVDTRMVLYAYSTSLRSGCFS